MAYLRSQRNQQPNSDSPAYRLAFVISFCFLSFFAESQGTEYGGGPGVLNYAGDLVRGYKITNVSPAMAVHYRMNYSKELSLKWSLLTGSIKSSEVPLDAFARQRNASYSIRIAELSSVAEYHFLEYKHEKSRIRWTPYAFGGVGFARILKADQRREEYNNIQVVIPFGLGFKHLVGKRFSIDTEVGIRKTFFDWVDNTSYGDPYVKDYQYGNPNDNDWYSFVGVSLSYIIYEIPCPFPYIPNKYMLRAKFR